MCAIADPSRAMDPSASSGARVRYSASRVYPDLRRNVLKLALDGDTAAVQVGAESQVLKDVLPGRADAAQLHPCPKFLKLMGEAGHERWCEYRVGSERLHHLRLRVNPNSRGFGRDCIAVVGCCEKRGFREELASTRGMEDHKMIVDGASD